MLLHRCPTTGGGDFTTVQAAANAVTPGGCIFLIDQGVWNFEQVLLDNTADVTIYGCTMEHRELHCQRAARTLPPTTTRRARCGCTR